MSLPPCGRTRSMWEALTAEEILEQINGIANSVHVEQPITPISVSSTPSANLVVSTTDDA